tara:strand:- start:206 stop:559 length:354 start_codon:yes stop_codon:yes gene_type:complete
MAGMGKRILASAKRKRKLFKSRDERKEARAERKKSKFESKGTRKLTQRGRQKEIGASKETKVSRGAKSVEKTKGGEYVKYAKKSKAAGSFRSAFKSSCKGDAKGFEWQGRKYSCARK